MGGTPTRLSSHRMPCTALRRRKSKVPSQSTSSTIRRKDFDQTYFSRRQVAVRVRVSQTLITSFAPKGVELRQHEAKEATGPGRGVPAGHEHVRLHKLPQPRARWEPRQISPTAAAAECRTSDLRVDLLL